MPSGNGSQDDRRKQADKDQLNRSYGLISVGTEFIASIAVPGLIGWWLDGWLKTRPWIMVAGIMLGFAAGIAQMVRLGRNKFRD